MDRYNDLQVFAGNANPALAEKICEYLDIPLGDAYVGRFPDGEIDIKINDDVRGSDVFVIQPTCAPVNENLVELVLMVDTLKRASAERITAVIPYYGYARKDRKDEGRVPISAKLMADLLTTAGAQRILTLDLHATQIQGFFNIPVGHLYAATVFLKHLKSLKLDNLCVVAPDVGSIKLNRRYSRDLKGDLAIVDKRRITPQSAEVVNIIGNVTGKNVVIVDDMISTGGSITEAAKAVKSRGAKDVYLCATHAVLCGGAVEKLNTTDVQRIIVTDTIPLGEKQVKNLDVLTIAPLLGEAIRRIHRSESVSYLFE
ncbi:MAG: ribose-phosphate pyrophosphokinase [Planctomycetes bacterium]|nr:ribose-phosphate pyrophosphokinase [Planctomycetota bacterium]